MTETEWRGLQATLVHGGLREYVDRLLLSRVEALDCPPISDANRALLYQAYDDGDGNTVTIHTGKTGYYEGWWDGEMLMEGVEIDGVAYNICPESSGGLVTVFKGDAIVENQIGVTFRSTAEAKAYIKGLTSK